MTHKKEDANRDCAIRKENSPQKKKKLIKIVLKGKKMTHKKEKNEKRLCHKEREQPTKKMKLICFFENVSFGEK